MESDGEKCQEAMGDCGGAAGARVLRGDQGTGDSEVAVGLAVEGWGLKSEVSGLCG
jgi:hypothetical protein